MHRSLRIAVIAPSHSPIVQPFSGGQAAHVWWLTRALIDRGHQVTLFAPPGSDARLRPIDLALDTPWLSADARGDVSMPSDVAMGEHHAYLSLMLELADDPTRFDVLHNQSLHHLPVAMARLVGTPMVTTLHTPPTPWLESAVRSAGVSAANMSFAAVSADTARRWRPHLGPVDVIRNGVDLLRWPYGPGGPDLVWTGRLVPEKAPHLAIRAARLAGRRLVLAGPVADAAYFAAEIEPLLGPAAVYAGHLGQAELARLVGRSSVAVVTPRWNEPYGLVVAEALACGTPVAALARGGIPEIVDATSARLVTDTGSDDETARALAGAIERATRLRRADARARAERACSIAAMVDGYEQLFLRSAALVDATPVAPAAVAPA